MISCPAPYTANSWAATAPASDVACTVSAVGTGYSSPSRISYSVDNNKTFTTAAISQSSSSATAKTTVTLPKAAGGHNLRAYAISPTGKQSGIATYSTGWGAASLLTPAPDPQVTTTDTLAILAAGPPKGVSVLPAAKTQWRMSGADIDTAGWVDVPAAGHALTVTETGGQTRAAGSFNTSSVVEVADGSGQVVNGRVPTLLEVRVCLAYSTGSQCTPASTVLKVPHAFGGGYPVAEAGPGRVSLWTGELQVDDSDADLAISDGLLSVSRTHSSFDGAAAAPQNRVFGLGWTASIDGDDGGAGGAELVDGTSQDGTLAVVDADGTALVFLNPTKKRRTGTTIPVGSYLPADVATEQSGGQLVVSGSGAETAVEVTTERAVTTRYQAAASPTTAPTSFKTVEIRDAADNEKTTYSYDSAGRITAIVAPLPDGVTACVAGTATAGCRALKISYATATTATATTPGAYLGQVKDIRAQVNTDADRVLTSYKYDSAGRMVEARDVRANLATSYSWVGSGTELRLATLTPPGQGAFNFAYENNKLSKVTRPNPATAGGGTAQLSSYIYGIPVAGRITDLPDMAVEVSKWNQASAPSHAAAIFGADKPVTTAPAAGSPDWTHADLLLTDREGYTVNTAKFGAGKWQLTATDYDGNGNAIRQWDERAIGQLREGTIDPGAAAQLASLTVYNEDLVSNGKILTSAGSLITDSYGPVHQVAATNSAADGSALLRIHKKRYFDQGAPNDGINVATGQPYRLPTRSVTTSETAGGDVHSTLAVSFTGYEAVAVGDLTGWRLGQPTTTTTDMDASGTANIGDITKVVRYDARGRIIEQRQPRSSGADAGTRITTYYTGSTSAVSGCGSKPEWAGLVCKVGPAAQPAGQTMPTTTTTYNWDQQIATEVDTSGGVTATRTTSYDSGTDRPIVTSATVTGLANSTAVPNMSTSYDPATGEITGTSSGAGNTAVTYDSWGRQLVYTNAPAGQVADTATTTYNAIGQVVSVIDNNGQTTYAYDGADASGAAERRGLTTAVKVKLTNGTEYTASGAYDQAGVLVSENLPGRITRRLKIDVAGQPTELSYSGQVIDANTSAVVDDQPWFGWTTSANGSSQVVREWTPDGAAGYDSSLGGTAVASDRNYAYDRAGRLTKVEDRTGNQTSDTEVVACTTRTYAFDVSGNRIAQKSHPANADGECTTGSAGTSLTRAYDSADRATTGANGTGNYTYDQLGRQTGIPAADAPRAGSGGVALAYYDNNNVRSITQSATTTNFTLDGNQRRLSEATLVSGVTTNSLVRHYTDDEANPTWTVDTTGGSAITTRYSELLSSDLGLTLTTTGTSTVGALVLSNPRGDATATVTLPGGATGVAGTAAAGIDNWTDHTEYGAPRQGTSSAGGGVTGVGYGWLGAKQRGTVESGLVLMGARLYNSATASFSSTDPLPGGTDTPYAYPSDPINSNDLLGLGNGCGGGAAAVLIPDWYYRAHLTPACEIHDRCYSRNSSTSRYTCDRRFEQDLCYQCRRAYYGNNPRMLRKCTARANDYYWGVRWFGKRFYKGRGSNR